MGGYLLAIAHEGERQRFSGRMRSDRRGSHKGAQRRAYDRAERSDGDFHADSPHQAATNQHELCNWPEIWPPFDIIRDRTASIDAAKVLENTCDGSFSEHHGAWRAVPGRRAAVPS